MELVELTTLDDVALADLGDAISNEQRRRAIASGDPAALVAEGFDIGFTRNGVREPWMRDGLLVCPGLLVGVGSMRHDCTFAKVGDTWSWDSSDGLLDEVRHVPLGSKTAQQSISVLAVPEHTIVDVITSRFQGGSHRMTRSVSYELIRGELIVVATRTPSVAGLKR